MADFRGELNSYRKISFFNGLPIPRTRIPGKAGADRLDETIAFSLTADSDTSTAASSHREQRSRDFMEMGWRRTAARAGAKAS